ncbi:MAG: carbohydrate-binding domain-containing protein [Bacteroidota bacterium]|nr:carbohydrate-binding domain-containing protein [Bacteroidota bacterium]
MKKINILLVICFLTLFVAKAQDTILMYHNGSVVYQNDIQNISNLKMTNNTSNLLITEEEGSTTLPISSIDSIIFGSNTNETANIVYVIYEEDTAYVLNMLEDNSNITTTVSGANVSIIAETGISNIEYYLVGSSSDGSFYLESDKKFKLSLGGLDLTSLTTIPIRLKKDKTTTIEVVNGTENTLTDNSASDGKAVINTKGETTFTGAGTLTCIANKKNGISSDNDLIFSSPTIDIIVNADAGKGIKSDLNVYIPGGNISIEANGSIVMEEIGAGYDPSYCSGIGADSSVNISGGILNITLPSTNAGGKGISTDGNMTISGSPIINIVSAASGATYIDTSGSTDSYKSSCLKLDGNLLITGGMITLSASGAGGKCINADGTIIITETEISTPNIIASTTGEHFVEVQGSGWGAEDNTDYAQPKAIKAEGNFYISGGIINVSTENDGGEGLESKDTMFISGGEITLNTYDDAINAANHIDISGGKIYARSTGNDAIDANGTITISGGLVIAIGTGAPEGGFDCDQNTFKIIGGTIIGIGGEHSTPTSSVCTQRVILKSGVSANQAINFTDNSNNSIIMFQIPAISSTQGGQPPHISTLAPNYGPGGGPNGGNNGFVLFLSSPNISTGTYKLYTGGSISEGTEWNGYYTNGTYTGTNYTSINVSSMVTNN